MVIILLICLVSSVIGIECSSLPSQKIKIDFWSDLDDWVVGNLYPNGAYAVASKISNIKSTRPYGLKIWESELPYDLKLDSICYIGKSFYIPGNPISATLDIVADDNCTVVLNSQITNCFTTKFDEYKLCDVSSYIISGLNKLNITVTNQGNQSGSNEAYVNYWLSVTTSVKMIDIVN